jgi:FkbM family methyltransferase
MTLNEQLNIVENLARATAAQRFATAPMRYVWAQTVHKIYFPITQRGVFATAQTFFNHPLSIVLPAATDIYLTGGKTHDSEIRLAKFLIQAAPQTNAFLDIGAHVGYYASLMATLLTNKGKVVAVEAASGTFELLKTNLNRFKNAIPIHAAATATDGENLTFHEFPVLYSEFNSIDIQQFTQEKWFKKFKPKAVEVVGVTVDSLVKTYDLVDAVIKIDAEGAEAQVVAGMTETLKNQRPTVIMEYLADHNESHQTAFKMLTTAGFKPHAIDLNGNLKTLHLPADYLKKMELDSDNFVFLK